MVAVWIAPGLVTTANGLAKSKAPVKQSLETVRSKMATACLAWDSKSLTKPVTNVVELSQLFKARSGAYLKYETALKKLAPELPEQSDALASLLRFVTFAKNETTGISRLLGSGQPAI
jgi:hypothetical protein